MSASGILRAMLGLPSKKKKNNILNDPTIGSYWQWLLKLKYRYHISYMGYDEPPYTYAFFGNTLFKNYMNLARDTLDNSCRDAILPIAIGCLDNKVLVSDLNKLRHVMVTGVQGSGKTIGIKSILTSLIYLAPPNLYNLSVFDLKGDLTNLSKFGNYYHTIEQIKQGLGEVKKWHESITKTRKQHKLADLEELNDFRISKGQKPIKYNIVYVDEFYVLSQRFPEIWKEVESLMSIGRSQGFRFIIATQRADHKSISTTTRFNASTFIGFKQKGVQDSSMAGVRGAENLKKAGQFIFSSGMLEGLQLYIPSTSHTELRQFLINLEAWAGKTIKNNL